MIINNYSLFSSHGPRICWVQSNAGLGQHRRKDPDNAAAVDSFGARTIRAEMKNQYDIVPLSKIGDYDFALISLTSVVEIENILRDMARMHVVKGDCKVIAGGMGCLNPWPLYDLLDVAVFGRGEGQINDIIDGAHGPNIWRKTNDPGIEDEYEIRQADHLLPGEHGIGCPNKCTYCQYTHVRRYTNTGKGYRAATVDQVYEDDWNRLKFKQGRNITAWDGLSEETRRRVHKAVTDKGITDKLSELRERGFPRTTNIKVFNIVGYPWETAETYNADMDRTRDLLSEADGPGGRVFMMMLHTPFSPEPYTPMQNDDVSFTNWRDVANARGRQVYKGRNIEMMVLPQIAGPHTLQRRIALNRAHRGNYQQVGEWVAGSREALDDFYSALDVGQYKGPRLQMGNPKISKEPKASC